MINNLLEEGNLGKVISQISKLVQKKDEVKPEPIIPEVVDNSTQSNFKDKVKSDPIIPKVIDNSPESHFSDSDSQIG
jgi:hypothetical protein